MRMKSTRITKQSNIPYGRCVAVSILVSFISNILALFHASVSAVNLILAAALCIVCFKRVRVKSFQRLAMTIHFLLIIILNLPSIMMTTLLVLSFVLCFAGRLDWNELAATL